MRCKFVCIKTGETRGWSGGPAKLYSAEFEPVLQGSPENDAFYAATPFGKFEVGVVAGHHFEVGKAYFIDINSAE